MERTRLSRIIVLPLKKPFVLDSEIQFSIQATLGDALKILLDFHRFVDGFWIHLGGLSWTKDLYKSNSDVDQFLDLNNY
jgi:hypothetical protein